MNILRSENKKLFIYPWEREDVNFWAKKWGVTSEELNRAIVETGSIRVHDIRKHLIEKGVIFSFASVFRHLLK